MMVPEIEVCWTIGQSQVFWRRMSSQQWREAECAFLFFFLLLFLFYGREARGCAVETQPSEAGRDSGGQ